MTSLELKSLEKYKSEGHKVFYFNEELFLSDPDNFQAVIRFVRKHYDGVVTDEITAADVDIRKLKIANEIIIFKDSGDFLFMVNETHKSGGIVEKIYADLANHIDVKPNWCKSTGEVQ